MKKVVDFLIVCPGSVRPAVSSHPLVSWPSGSEWLQGGRVPSTQPVSHCAQSAAQHPHVMGGFFHLPLYIKFCFHQVFQISWFKYQKAKASLPAPFCSSCPLSPKRLQLQQSLSLSGNILYKPACLCSPFLLPFLYKNDPVLLVFLLFSLNSI